MAILSLVLLTATVIAGLWLLGAHMRSAAPEARWQLIHAGLAALTALAIAAVLAGAGWQAPDFAWQGLVLLGIASLGGLALWLLWPRLGLFRPGVLVLHAMLGMAGFYIVANWLITLFT